MTRYTHDFEKGIAFSYSIWTGEVVQAVKAHIRMFMSILRANIALAMAGKRLIEFYLIFPGFFVS
jgi:hypothetical protein